MIKCFNCDRHFGLSSDETLRDLIAGFPGSVLCDGCKSVRALALPAEPESSDVMIGALAPVVSVQSDSSIPEETTGAFFSTWTERLLMPLMSDVEFTSARSGQIRTFTEPELRQ